jgi:hypothetical protein
VAFYNNHSGYYELQLTAPDIGGIYKADIKFTDLYGDVYNDMTPIQVWAKEEIKIDTNKVFIWIFNSYDFSVKDIIEVANYEISIDEETNSSSLINILKKTTAKANDIIAFKKNNAVVYWGTVKEIQNEDGKQLYEYITKHVTNIFDQKIKLGNEAIIREVGIEDFIAKEITDNFISNADTFINRKYLQVIVNTHTPKQTSVTNVENGIYNLHTYMTNCTQNYDIVYSFSIVNKKLVITIENKSYNKELIDTQAQAISNYQEVFETNLVSKVVVLYNKVKGIEQKGEYILYLKNDRTTTNDMNDIDRANGRVETVYTENYEDAQQLAVDTMKANSYNHKITFNMYEKYMKVGTPIAIKTKESLIFDTYISAVKITDKKFYEYTCGNIRINFIDKLLKERKG